MDFYYMGFSVGAGFNFSTPTFIRNNEVIQVISFIAHFMGFQVVINIPLWRVE
jgi:hypothetical protein